MKLSPFQYQKGAIKTEEISGPPPRAHPFQYQKGAIKTSRGRSRESSWTSSFNTKKVRLKLVYWGGYYYHFARKFQYQKGAIKTADSFGKVFEIDLFQYQKGAIKTNLQQAEDRLHRMFQYQKGAIKTTTKATSSKLKFSFQYQKGAIKTGYFRKTARWRKYVSIPKRCD